jgi:hypothetical protein
MNRYVAGVTVPLIVGLPVWIKPVGIAAVVAILAGLICFTGLARRSLGVTLCGCVLAMMDLALALWWAGSSLSVLGAASFGLALLFLLDTVHFAGWFAGAEVDPAAWRSHLAWWIGRAAISCGAAIVLTLLALVLAAALPSFGRPILAGVGALAVFVAAVVATPARAQVTHDGATHEPG